MIEILAPAGDKQCALAAINAGADAIYLGLTAFSARSSAGNFNREEFAEISSLARLFGVKIYVAMNTIVKQNELEDFVKTAIDVHNSGADAIILQDIYLGAYLKKCYPQMVLHLSTQAGVCNGYGARLAKDCGFSRVIAARETKLEDIAEISQIIETEAFVQGALCTCFSGQCYLSSFAGGNSGNRGKCKQPCRKKYSIDRAGYEESRYAISLSDLSVGEDISKLINAGVTSFKIEGRMRRPEYVSAAVKYYKKLLGKEDASSDLSALRRTYNRGNYTRGLAFGQGKNFISAAVQGHIGEYCGVVSVVGGKYFCESLQKCGVGDGFKILREGSEVGGAAFAGEAKGGFYLSCSAKLKNGDKVFITTDASLNKELLGFVRLYNVKISARAEVGKSFEVILNGKKYSSDFTVCRAQNAPITESDITRCFAKTDAYKFAVGFGEIYLDGDAFIRMSDLNRFRREVYLDFYNDLTACKNARIEKTLPLPKESAESGIRKTAVIARDLRGLSADVGILKPDDYYGDFYGLCSGFEGEKFLYLPPYLSGEEIGRLKPAISRFDGIYCGGNYSVYLAAELNKKLFAGTGFNLSNSVALSFLKADYFAISKELTLREADSLINGKSFYLAGGGIQVMDLIYCPFSETCSTCDKRDFYMLEDEEGRKFPLRRYAVGACRFELFNCRKLAGEIPACGRLYDLTCESSPKEAMAISDDIEKLKNYYGDYTKGHGKNPVL